MPIEVRLARVHRMLLELGYQVHHSSLPEIALQAAEANGTIVSQLGLDFEVPEAAAV